MSDRKMRLAAYFNPTGHHVASWRHPRAQVDAPINIDHYVEIARPQRLLFMLHSPDCAPKEVPLGGAPHATRVTATFTPQDSGCSLELMHDGLAADRAMRVEARWTGMFYGLGVVLEQNNDGDWL